jgi:hypothetical protein
VRLNRHRGVIGISAPGPDISGGSPGQLTLSEPLLGLLGRLSTAPAVDPAVSALVDQAVAVLRRPGSTPCCRCRR